MTDKTAEIVNHGNGVIMYLTDKPWDLKVNIGHDVDIPSALWYLEHKYGVPSNCVTVRDLTV
jgi:hypothetical protein